MYVENLKIDLYHRWDEVIKVRKSKKHPDGKKYISHSDQKVGSVYIDWGVDTEGIEALIDAIQENVFKHDGVKLDVNFNTNNW